jgi:hypothetical protein
MPESVHRALGRDLQLDRLAGSAVGHLQDDLTAFAMPKEAYFDAVPLALCELDHPRHTAPVNSPDAGTPLARGRDSV